MQSSSSSSGGGSSNSLALGVDNNQDYEVNLFFAGNCLSSLCSAL
jgi:hypothetical protein